MVVKKHGGKPKKTRKILFWKKWRKRFLERKVEEKGFRGRGRGGRGGGGQGRR
jgi:hypothetical protein